MKLLLEEIDWILGTTLYQDNGIEFGCIQEVLITNLTIATSKTELLQYMPTQYQTIIQQL